MKKIFIINSLLLFIAVANAQLKVESTGDVKLTKNLAVGTDIDNNAAINIYHLSQSSSLYCGIKSYIQGQASMPVGSFYGVYGYVDATTQTSASSYPYYRLVGVYGRAMKHPYASNKFSAGVAGVANMYTGIGVYGAIGMGNDVDLPTSWSLSTGYAGYFSGSVRVTGTLTAAAVTTTSDERLKDDLKDIQPAEADKLLRLRPVSYKFKSDDSTHYVYCKEAKEMHVRHYGLVAQELQEVFPDMVYDTGDGYLSVNYIELIPLLIQTIQKQQEQIDELTKIIGSNENRVKHNSNANTQASAILYQNTPNPFSSATEIGYYIPTTVQKAELIIYNMSGEQIVSYPINDFGNGSVTITANTLSAGMYMYALIVDEQLIDTKRMILTK